jgi:hypothetical protein
MIENPLHIFVFLAILNSATIYGGMEKAGEMPKSETVVFTTVVYPYEWSETNALLLVESIRSFAGSLSRFPIWCFVPQYGKELSATTVDRLTKLNAKLIPYDVSIDTTRFFFAADIRAAWLAESMAIGKTDLLVWLGSNTIILHEPRAFLLDSNKNLGYRPVHHMNVGSSYDAPLDPFWELIYEYCQVPEERVFPMKTHVDAKIIRPYFNAGMLVTRPEKKLFKEWHDTFYSVYQASELQALYKQDERYIIFAHQAILSGVILHTFRPDEITELPNTYNYPIHLYDEDVTGNRPSRIDQLITLRHEGFYQDPEWMDKMPAGDSLKQWLSKIISE